MQHRVRGSVDEHAALVLGNFLLWLVRWIKGFLCILSIFPCAIDLGCYDIGREREREREKKRESERER